MFTLGIRLLDKGMDVSVQDRIRELEPTTVSMAFGLSLGLTCGIESDSAVYGSYSRLLDRRFPVFTNPPGENPGPQKGEFNTFDLGGEPPPTRITCMPARGVGEPSRVTGNPIVSGGPATSIHWKGRGLELSRHMERHSEPGFIVHPSALGETPRSKGTVGLSRGQPHIRLDGS